MAGTAPTDFQFTKTLDAGPVHCSVWLSSTSGPRLPTQQPKNEIVRPCESEA
jgi:hypothetical protein